MADEHIQPGEHHPREPKSGSASGPRTNRPADHARISRANEAPSFDWAGSDEATDFLGLNDTVEHAPGETSEHADPYAMPGAPPAEGGSRTTWLLNEAAHAHPQSNERPPAAQPADWGVSGTGPGDPSWLMEGREPAPLPAPGRADMPLPETLRAAAAVAEGHAGTNPNWLLSLDDQRANRAGNAPVVPGSQEAMSPESPRGLEASFVDPEPSSRAFGRVVRRSLTAAAVLAGGLVVWQVLSHHGDVAEPLAEPVTIDRGANQRRQLERPVDRGTDMGGQGERTAIVPPTGVNGGQGSGSPGVTGTGGATRRWYSNVASDGATEGGSPSESSELDPDSYPWPAPSEREVSAARSVLLSFDELMGDLPVADAGSVPEPVPSESGSYFERVASRMLEAARETPSAGSAPSTGTGLAPAQAFDSLTVVVPDALETLGPRPNTSTTEGSDLPPVPRWTKLDERLMPADRSVLDQYYAWRLSGAPDGAQRMDYVPRVGMRASIEPTFGLPFLVATVGVGEDFLRDGGPMPAAGFDRAELAGQSATGTTDGRVTVESTLIATPDTAPDQNLDPRRIEKDPLFSFQARVPGTDTKRKTLENHWMGVNVPMHALDYPERVLTPRVGAVRVMHHNGEGFEGDLFAMGRGQVWVDTKIGRMTLTGDSIKRIERLDESRARALRSGDAPVAGLSRVRVKTPGGVFVGFELYREGEQITMLTEKGYKITLPSDDVELASTARASSGIKRRGR